VNAAELLECLGRPRVPGSGGLAAVVTGLPVEVALATQATDTAMRRTWRDRQKGRATPLLVLHDASGKPGLVRVLGPADERAAVREVPADRLAELLTGLAGASRLTASRQLAEELARLDEQGTPGLIVKGLLTRHIVTTRLREGDDWRWMADATSNIAHDDDWRSTLTAMGYRLERRPRRGWLARAGNSPALVVHPTADPAEFTRLDRDGRPPEGLLAVDCAAENVPYGVLASRGRLRLFRFTAEPGAPATTTTFLELDTATLRQQDRPLLGLLAPSSLRSDGHFARLVVEARRFGSALRDRLDIELRLRVLPELARGLGAWALSEGRDLADAASREELERACLTWVFRALFVLYAESAGYLPLDHAGYAANAATTLATEATEAGDILDARSTSLWDRFRVLVQALRTGDIAMRVPAYNGDLFSADALLGASVLERASLSNATFGRVLAALGHDPATGTGVDYSSLEVGHLGHIYEGLLSLRLSLADVDLTLYSTGSKKEERFEPTRSGDEAGVRAGDLFWQTNTGGRKAGGVYYTPDLLVEHLVSRAVLPALDGHLHDVRRITSNDPAEAARRLFQFRVLDPACGSAHFLVAALHRIAERVGRFLADNPLPAVRDELEQLRAATGVGHGSRVEHADLLHRLVLKRCIYGVDVSPMGAEVARLSLWLASFVPGLSLAYLGHNVQVGDSLVGVANPDVLTGNGHPGLWDEQVHAAIADGATAATKLLAIDDRTPDQYADSLAADQRLRKATESIARLFDAWTAGPLGVTEARAAVLSNHESVLDGSHAVLAEVRPVIERMQPLHWPLAFPEVFAAPRPGFDAVIGNPPWEEVTVEELAFYARHSPRLRGLSAGPREKALTAFKKARPELAEQFAAEQQRTALLRAFLGPNGGYSGSVGDPDLYKFFCQRYRMLLAPKGCLGVVLPRSTFLTAGSRGFRRWLFGSSRVDRIDFLVNNRLWIFETHPQYTIALLVASATSPDDAHSIEIAGVAASAEAFRRQASVAGISLRRSALGPDDEMPLLPSQDAEPVLRAMRRHRRFPYGGERWRCFPVAEFHETNDKKLWQGATQGWALWKGESFDQHDPHGAEARWCPPDKAAMKKATKPRPGSESILAREVSLDRRRAAAHAEVGNVRLAFRDVSRAADSRTVRASLVPAETFLTNTAPYLSFVEGGHRERAACAAVMNSLPFDWQARRFAEIHLNFFVLELLTVPDLDDLTFAELVRLGGRLSCPDRRFAEVADACGVQHGPLDPEERLAMRARVDALVAHAYGLGPLDLDVLLADFTIDAVPRAHRERLRGELENLCR
jgi:Eco57I restriction-modification methylase